VVAAHKPKNITELEAIAHEEWAKIPQKCLCQQQMGVLLSTKDACHEVVE